LGGHELGSRLGMSIGFQFIMQYESAKVLPTFASSNVVLTWQPSQFLRKRGFENAGSKESAGSKMRLRKRRSKPLLRAQPPHLRQLAGGVGAQRGVVAAAQLRVVPRDAP